MTPVEQRQWTLLQGNIEKALRPLKNLQKMSQNRRNVQIDVPETRVLLKALITPRNDLQKVVNSARLALAKDRAVDKYAQAEKKLQEIERQNKAAQGYANSLARKYGGSAQNAPDRLNQQRNTARKAYQAYQEQGKIVADLKTKMEDLGIPADKYKKQQAELTAEANKAGQVLAAQGPILRQQTQNLERLAAASKKYERTTAKAAKLKQLGGVSLSAGKNIMSQMLQLESGLAFEQSMRTVQRATGLGKSDPLLQALSQQARHIGESGQTDANQVASTQAHMADIGFSPEDIRKAIPDIITMSRANNAGLQKTADIAKGVMTGFNIDDVSQIGRIADVMTSASLASGVSLQQLGEIMQEIAPATEEAKLGLEQAAAMAAMIGESGSEIVPENYIDRVKNIGIQGTDSKYQKVIDGHQGTAHNLAMEMDDNVEGDITRVTSALNELRLLMYDLNKGALSEMARFITPIIRGLNEWIRAHPGLASALTRTILLGGMMLTGFGALATGVSTAVSAFAAMRMGMAVLGTRVMPFLARGISVIFTAIRANPLVAIATAIVGVGVYIWRNWERMTELFKNADYIGIGIFIIEGLIAGLSAMTGGLVGMLYELCKQIVNGFCSFFGISSPSKLFEGFGINLIEGLLNGISAMFGNVMALFTELGGNIINGITGMFSGAMASIVEFGSNALSNVTGMLSNMGTAFTEAGGNIISGLGAGIKSGFTGAKEAVVGAGSKMVGWFRGKLGIESPSRVFAQLGMFTMLGLTQGIASAEESPLAAIDNTAQQIIATAQSGLGGLEHLFGGDNPVLSVIGQVAQGVVATAQNGLQAIGGMLGGEDAIRFDNRAPLATAGAGAAAPGDMITNNFTITINPAPGMDERQLAALVGQVIEQHEREGMMRRRSRLGDLE